MDIAEMKEMLPIIHAYINGKVVEHQDEKTENWEEIPYYKFLIGLNDRPHHYRVKSEPKYRPFKNAEECWNEMLKHQPFGWIRIEEEAYVSINTVGETYLFLDKEGAPRHYDRLFRDVTFADGQPFGILE